MKLDRSRLLGFRITGRPHADGHATPAPIASKVGKLDKQERAAVPAPMRSKIGAKS